MNAEYEAVEVRKLALDAALRCAHPGSVPSEVLRVAREFERYLSGPRNDGDDVAT
jgi:hypothetical protein